MKRFIVLIFTCIFFSIFSANFVIEEVKMRTFPVELFAFLIHDQDTNKNAVYVLDYFEFYDNQAPCDIVKNFKPLEFEKAQDCFFERKLNKKNYGILAD